ncbi:MAG: hypothetical protein J0I32_21010 [Sphingobacteriales bacterium]|nr:hypothetical protein [Sphingobacteriales bacterium]OJW02146.1 MAG: hypothetical protein BGO52_22360 [Sphingobacteriales bacterium 44-61]
MRIVLWIGNEPNQKALANKINNLFPISGIITESRISKKRITAKKVVEKVIQKIFLSSIGKAWKGMQKHNYQSYPEYPPVERLNVEDINSEEAYAFTKKINPDLILVSGTRLVKDKMLSINPKIGILNLHTGLSPYIKGGPNCTNWCIATEQFHLIGNTIMWIDRGIDSGNILTTEFTELNGNESLLTLHIKVMDHAHSLYLKALDYLSKGYYKSVPQSDIDKGKTYYTKEWTFKRTLDLLFNHKKMDKYFKSGKIVEDRKNIRVVEI